MDHGCKEGQSPNGRRHVTRAVPDHNNKYSKWYVNACCYLEIAVAANALQRSALADQMFVTKGYWFANSHVMSTEFYD